MKRRQLNDFTGFSFGSIHSSELGLTVVSTSNRYEKNLLPAPTDTTIDIPGGNGTYYFGQLHRDKEISINVAFDGISEELWRKIAQVFANDKPQNLIFDELPYKAYKAKLKDKPKFTFVCFLDKETGERVYKGEGSFTFICYYPYAFCFNKYVVRASDSYYTPHKRKKYTDVIKQTPRAKLINEKYNATGNMETPWWGGYPTKEQVQSGELYFKLPNSEEELIVETRAYWENVPEWQSSAKLLVSPTLDYDGELIFMPQYSKVNCYNMDMGLNKENGLIGSRILVYNPGDLPVEFKLKLGNLSSSLRRNLDSYSFRISRYNVQRLTIEQAVDWTGLKTLQKEDNELFKYGQKYFSLIEPQKSNIEKATSCFTAPEQWNFNPYFRELKCAHPAHTYIVEPIPREKLGHFIKLFFWQNEWESNSDFDGDITDNIEQGFKMADRYDELYKNCITDEERFELYWTTLKDLFQFFGEQGQDAEQLFINYVQNPPEFFINNDLDYGEFVFNAYHYPQYYTYDYLDINNKNFDKIHGGEVNKVYSPLADARREYTLPLFLDSERRMLYNLNKNENKYNFNTSKNIHNENIEKGRWFKIPTGWSIIDISPILSDDKWGGKRWLDARPFEWGNTNDNYRVWYDKVYRIAAIDYLSQNITLRGLTIGDSENDNRFNFSEYVDNPKMLKKNFSNISLSELENYMQFSRWYNYDNVDYFSNDTLEKEINKKNAENAELGFLKTLANYWRVNRICTKDGERKPIGDINDWWWYANNYIWNNFPPLYWGYADLLNHAEIEYIPLFY